MDAERVRALIKKLAHVEESVQWGEALVFWVGDKAIGGKMFAVARTTTEGKVVLSFSAGAEGYAELLEREGVIPAPYLARAYWVGLEHWGALDARELEARLTDAHARTYARLPNRTKEVLALPAAARRALIAERRAKLSAGSVAKAGGGLSKKRAGPSTRSAPSDASAPSAPSRKALR